MIIKIKKDKKIPTNKGWCFCHYGYDEELINRINNGEEVEVDKIHPLARDLVKQVKEKEKE
jgi:hypothetical protein